METEYGLKRKRCVPCEGIAAPLKEEQIKPLLRGIQGWLREGNAIVKSFAFADYHEVMAFVNAVAWIAHREGHHPDMTVGYNQVRVAYSTHAIDGLSENDFNCAALADVLFQL
jgi:4a-hydroxytetrahydrobiopterin dehydratase